MPHTPGPWQTGRKLLFPDVISSVHSEDHWVICEASRMYSREETAANMHLIAAAPDLLEACKALFDYDSSYWNAEDGDDAEILEAIELARIAIAKAEGK